MDLTAFHYAPKGKLTATDIDLTWDVKFSEPVVMRTNIHTNFTSMANATIPDMGTVRDTILVDVPGVGIEVVYR